MATNLKCAKLIPHPNNRAVSVEDPGYKSLVAAIRQDGFKSLITVRKLAVGEYQILCGHRRWQAAQEAGLKVVPCEIVEDDDLQALDRMTRDNAHRVNPCAVDNFHSCVAMKELGKSYKEIGDFFGESVDWVRDVLRLRKLSPEVLAEGLANRWTLGKLVGMTKKSTKPVVSRGNLPTSNDDDSSNEEPNSSEDSKQCLKKQPKKKQDPRDEEVAKPAEKDAARELLPTDIILAVGSRQFSLEPDDRDAVIKAPRKWLKSLVTGVAGKLVGFEELVSTDDNED
jgi:ParB/RepB/Spo0J family partition protein